MFLRLLHYLLLLDFKIGQKQLKFVYMIHKDQENVYLIHKDQEKLMQINLIYKDQ